MIEFIPSIKLNLVWKIACRRVSIILSMQRKISSGGHLFVFVDSTKEAASDRIRKSARLAVSL